MAAWLAAHPDDAERIESYRRLAEELRSTYGGVLEEPVPERLSRALRPARVRRVAMIALWVGLGAALGGIAGWHLHSTASTSGRSHRPRGHDGAARSGGARDLFARSAPPGGSRRRPGGPPREVAFQAARHAVARAQLEAVGYSLVGGRLLPAKPARRRTSCISATAARASRSTCEATWGSNRSTAFRYAREGNVDVFYWVDSKSGYAVSSGDISKENLLNVANAAYQQLNPP